jgi:hypothetical protein
VARRLENRSGCHNRGIEFEHPLLDDEVLAPLINDVSLERRAWWSIVVETGDTYERFSVTD